MKKLITIALLLPSLCIAGESTCFGTTSNGSLENGVKLPSRGPNFKGYSYVAELAGRTYVHSIVRSIIVDAYGSLESSEKGKVFKFAETGFKEGGKFSPHKTHRNGLSVDFMVPVVNQSGVSVHLPTHLFNKLGYDIEFDSTGKYKDYKIDYVALAAHLVALHKAAKSKGYDLWRVIFDPKLQPNLLETKYGPYIRKHIQLSRKRSWVRHDEHYHVDFEIPCK